LVEGDGAAGDSQQKTGQRDQVLQIHDSILPMKTGPVHPVGIG
jgi:hypothetical protein